MLDAYKVINLLVGLAKDTRLCRYDDDSFNFWINKDGRTIDYPTQDMVDGLVNAGYLQEEKKQAEDGRNYVEYVVTEKGKQFVDLRDGRVAHAGEHFWVVKYERQGGTKGHIHIGFSPPDLSRLGQEEWEEGSRITVECFDMRRFPVEALSFDPI